MCWRTERRAARLLATASVLIVALHVAANSGGLAPKWRVCGAGYWIIVVPLWLPLSACAAGIAV